MSTQPRSAVRQRLCRKDRRTVGGLVPSCWEVLHTTVPQMPGTLCPSWCAADRGSAWLQQVEACRSSFADGEPRDPADYFEPMHSLMLHRGDPAR